MSVFDRARDDEARGDLGSARKRLSSHAAATRFDLEICEQVARISMRMQDPAEAGRWYFLCDSADLEAPAAIRCFLRSCGDEPRHVLSALPRGIQSRSDWPATAAARLHQIGFKPARAVEKPIATTRLRKAVDLVIMLVVIALLACTAIGVGTVLRWIVKSIQHLTG